MSSAPVGPHAKTTARCGAMTRQRLPDGTRKPCGRIPSRGRSRCPNHGGKTPASAALNATKHGLQKAIPSDDAMARWMPDGDWKSSYVEFLADVEASGVPAQLVKAGAWSRAKLAMYARMHPQGPAPEDLDAINRCEQTLAGTWRMAVEALRSNESDTASDPVVFRNMISGPVQVRSVAGELVSALTDHTGTVLLEAAPGQWVKADVSQDELGTPVYALPAKVTP